VEVESKTNSDFKSMKFEEFKGGPNRIERDVPRVTLNERGLLHMNKLAFEAFGSPGAVKLFFEENEMVIALKPADLRHRNAFPLKRHNAGSTRIIHALPLCKHYKIPIERTILFNEIDIDNEGTMFLSLKNTTRIGRRWD
jgi:hypothetical protein